MATQMNIQDCTALGARKAYTLRPYKHFGWGAVAFIPIFTGLIFILNPLVAGLIAGGLAFGLYFFLESRLMVIECPNCQQDINVNTPWECGFKGCRNENVDEFPFVHECGHCHYPPKAYVCHHCGSHIFLTSDRQKIHAAKRLEFKPEPVKTVTVAVDPTKAKKVAQAEHLSDLMHLRDEAKIKKEIEIINNSPSTLQPPTTSVETAMKDMENFVNEGMSDRDAQERLRKAVDLKYANDDHKRAQAHALIDEAVQRRFERRG